MPHQNFRRLGFALLATSLLIVGWMYWRMTREELWSYAPLALYLAAFGGTWLLRTYRKNGDVVADNKLSGLTGLLLGLGFPGILPIPLLLLVAFVPMFVLYRRLIAAEASYGKVFRHGYSAFLLFNILASYWVTNTAFGAGLFAMLTNSALMSLPWLVLYWTGRKSPKVAILAFAACWVAFEHFHYHWELNWPWLTLGNGFAQWPSLIQWYEVTGVLGGTAWILGCNYLAFKTFFAPAAAPTRNKIGSDTEETASELGTAPKKKASPLLFALLVVLPIIGSVIRYATYAPPAGNTITVASIQPNFEPHFEKFADRQQSAPLDTFIRLSKAALAVGSVDYLLFPETSFRQIIEGEPLNNRPMQLLQGELKGLGAKYLITGFSGYKIFDEGEPVTKAVQYFPSSGDSEMAVEMLNAAIQVDLETSAYQTYRKGVFVPGAESFPFRDLLPFMGPLVASVGGTVAGSGTQARRLPLSSPIAKVAPVICYESVFGEYFTDYIREGAQAIFVITNDGWWDNTAGHRQHLWFSSLRAIETRREVVRSANVGACAFIDQRGKIISWTRYDKAGFLRGELLLNDAITPYVRFGDLVSRVAMLLAGMVLLSNLARSLVWSNSR